MNQFKSTNSSPPIYRGEATSAANTTDETNKAKCPALDPTHALMHLPNLFHVPLATGDAQEHANKWVVLILVALGGFMTTLDSSIVNIAYPAQLQPKSRRSCCGGVTHRRKARNGK